jgi:hypothetical protein
MGKIAKATAGLTLSASLALVGFGAAPAYAAHVKPGQQWTNYINGGGGCEVETIEHGHMFVETSGVLEDVGTYTAKGKKATETWTSGSSAGLTMTGTWKKSAKD